MGRRRESPVEEADIRDMMIDGRGVADIEGKAVFVDGALTGERVRFRRRRRRRNVDEAELVEVLRPAANRVEPRCEMFGTCGGCVLQHLDAGHQLELKQKVLLDALQRIGGVVPAEVLRPLSGEAFGYRRRARLGARLVEKKGRVLVGFRERHKPYIADMRHCETLVPELAALVGPLAELIGGLEIAREVPQVELSAGDSRVSLVFRVLSSPGTADREKLQEFAVAHNAGIWLQTGGPQTLAPLDAAAEVALDYALPEFDVRLEYGPLDFVQVNQNMNRLMLRQAMELLSPQPGEAVLDLFCGIGNFSLPVARLGGRVTGVELDDVMVAKAEHNARLNGLANASFRRGDLTQGTEEQPWWEQGYAAVVLDPPRAGALEALPAVAATGANRLLYVSCHPGSLARDAGVLTRDHGFELVSAGAMDMFPQTAHVEAMALFRRKGAAA